ETIATKCRRASEQASTPFRSIVRGGGVGANAALRAALAAVAQDRQLELRLPPSAWCLDNAAMIAAAAHPRLLRGERDPLDLPAEPVSRWS
ncbi:MAG: tRNA (adenosine(37)-N6)-threonylcarbamoyltransferase complex transferase subunit TsaD, partial [Phycisphaerales bacterium]